MLPTGLFRSRWAALIWAAGILWTAYDVATANPTPASGNTAVPTMSDATGEGFNAADLATLANAGN